MSKRAAYGGVVIDSQGRILLREAAGHFAGDVWTFPKGGCRQGESASEAALRETREETGVVAEIIEQIPGVFAGSITDNTYFLMRPTGQAGEAGTETASVCWAATREQARDLIKQTHKQIARDRDLAVLDAALIVRGGPP